MPSRAQITAAQARTLFLAALIFVGSLSTTGCVVIEPLRSPERVTGRTGTGLTLADGRTVVLPEVATLAAETPLLDAATQRGVEVSEGRLYGQIRLHDWCGTSTVVYQLVRVDLAHLAIFAEEASPADAGRFPPPCPGHAALREGRWCVTSHRVFLMWEEEMAEKREAAPTQTRPPT